MKYFLFMLLLILDYGTVVRVKSHPFHCFAVVNLKPSLFSLNQFFKSSLFPVRKCKGSENCFHYCVNGVHNRTSIWTKKVTLAKDNHYYIFFEKPNIVVHKRKLSMQAADTVYSINVLDNSCYCQAQINTEFQKSSEIIVKRTFLRSDESFQPFNTFVLFDFFFKQKRFSKRNKTADKGGLSLDH